MVADQAARIVAGRYELVEALGRGGMGMVWRARDVELGREVALKEVRLPMELAEAERTEAHARVRREARTAARLSDEPGVTTVYDVVEAQGHPWVVMQLVRGSSLQHLLREHGPMPPARVTQIARTLLEALRAAHACGVVHRDIKPANVMLSRDGRVLLTDFGIATIVGETAVTRTGALVGSPEYMAPERLEGTGTAEPPSDLWSLGATLYTTVQGQSLFARDSVASTVAAIMSAPVSPPSRGAELTPLIMALLERDPARRPSADEALSLLAQAESQPSAGWSSGAQPGMAETRAAPPAPPSASPVAAPEPRSLARRFRGPIIAATAAMVAVIVVGVSLFWWSNRSVTTEYDWHRTDGFSLRYPEEWSVEESEDAPDTIVHPEEALGMGIAVGGYIPDEDEATASDELTRLTGPSEERHDYRQVGLDLSDIAENWPDDYEVGAVEETYTLGEDYVADQIEPDLDDGEFAAYEPERFRVQLQIHVPGEESTHPLSEDLRAYWLSWTGPQSERDGYDEVIVEVLGSFQPNT
ncbi:serine/threonine-protein kinase [Lipingzhangella sp. LS1_29]|uniref:non-specific serine/threonine protein kinase n=1 Tax=Lipingzhangella rawalii TaxID=2055835 RepID=A0ABU2H5L6_9ACTN|nr:serine/threonine-protein kinase [Lipingzhangella rawalii]MDS1270598.1 serine/threonine-protein kinase [Lipingzhangella rawalii]